MNATNTTKKFKVAICGGGIGGLTCAIALSQYPDIDVDIYEAAQKFTELGAGIGIWPRPWKALKALGLEPALYKVTDVHPREGAPVASLSFRKSDQPQGIDFHTMVTKEGLRTFHRADFQQVLLAHLPKSYKTHCAKRLRYYTNLRSGQIQLNFEDGSAAVCDVLIGADGIKSVVRGSLMREQAKSAVSTKEKDEYLSSVNPHWSGAILYRSVIPAERLKAYAPGHRALTKQTQYVGKHGFVMAYPISHGKLINIAACCARHDLENTPFQGNPVAVVDRDEFISHFSHWEQETRMLLSLAEKPMRWAIQTVKPLRSFVSGRVALLGDAAHAMTPYQGAGAGQAIEDAYVLATLLGHHRTTANTISRTLQIYDAVRRPYANKVAERCRLNGHYFTFHGVDYDTLSDEALRDKLRWLAGSIMKNWEWCWTTTLDGALKDAVRMLESS